MATPQNRFLASCGASMALTGLFMLHGAPGLAQQAPAEPAQKSEATPLQENAGLPTPEPLQAPDVYQQQMTLLAAELEDKNLVWLAASGEEFPALWQPDSSGNPFGAVLIAHGAGQTVDWPTTVKHLRATLGNFGWATLSITLPDPVAPSPPPRSEAPETSAESPSPDSPATAAVQASPPVAVVEPLASSRMKAAMDFLNSKGQYNIIFAGEGLGAARVSRYLHSISREFPAELKRQNVSNKKSKAIIQRPVRALILINARNQIPYDSDVVDKKIYDWFNDVSLPILDIYYDSHYLDSLEPGERKQAARRLHLENYIQVPLIESQTLASNGETQLSRRVRGFLGKYAKGVELDGAR